MDEIKKIGFLDYLRLLFSLKTQCCAETPGEEDGSFYYCIRTKFHFGKHQTFKGDKF